VPLDYAADWASGLAARWAIALHAAARRHAGRLRIRYGTRVASIIPTGAHPNLDVTFNPPLAPPAQFTFLLWATGFGKETCDVSPPGATPYRGLPFWGNDPFTQVNCGLTSPTPPRVLISGSGDGALQDFLRVLTKRESAEDIYRECRIPQAVADRLWDAEERAQRQMLWANGLRHEHVVHDWLEKEHEAAVKDALPRPEVQAGLARLLSHNIEPIALVYRCSHLTPQYGLNRFLTLLLARYLEEKHPRSRVTLLMKKSVVRVSGHACTGPVACHGKHHEVELEEYPQCWQPPGARVPTPLDADVLIIRHGIDRAGIVAPLPSALKSFLQLERAKHLLPYHPRP
jgi:hypothetical protein